MCKINCSGGCIECAPEEHVLGWQPEPRVREKNTRMIELRIACEDAGYPLCEARYVSIQDYEQQTGNKFEVTNV